MRVLIVDDDVKVRATVRVMLAQAGFTVSEVADGGKVIEAVRGVEADLVLCDLFMPERMG